MATTAPTRSRRSTAPANGRARRRGPGGWLRDNVVLLIGIAVLLYTFVPIAYIIALSFNVSSGPPKYVAQFEFSGFTLDNWTSICDAPDLCSSLRTSVGISLTATAGATILGTLMAFALVRHSFRGRAASNLVIFLPMATPEVVMGSSLLAMFVAMNMNSALGFTTIVIAHVMFCLSFVVVTVKARLTGMDNRLEQAAMDLYANEWQTFRLITLPLAMPGIIAAALLAFSLSFDDFIVTNFTSGTTQTFPLFIWGADLRGGLPPQLFPVGTILFLISFVFVVGGEVWRRRAASRF